MSEYQYYEFVAVDGPISDAGLRYAEGCSTRADVSRFRWKNSYNFGSFHGNVDELLKHYDAHFYIANWGTVVLALAFPDGCVNQKAIRPYLMETVCGYSETTLTAKNTNGRLVLYWEKSEEEYWDGWIDGAGLLDRLLGVREEIMCGDYRALFLGWLADFDLGKEGVLPPIPPGMGRLTPALRELAEQLCIDSDMLEVSASLSGEKDPEKTLPLGDLLDRMSTEEMKALLVRVGNGEGMRVAAEMAQMVRSSASPPGGEAVACADFADQIRKHRRSREETEKKEANERRRQAEEKHRLHLEKLIQQADQIWNGLDQLMEQKIASAYDKVAGQLTELRDAYALDGQSVGFVKRLADFQNRYSRRPAMMRRIEKIQETG